MSFVIMVSTRGMSDLRLIQALLDGGLILLIASLVTLFAASIGLSLNGERWGNRGVVRAGAYLVIGLTAFSAPTLGGGEWSTELLITVPVRSLAPKALR